VLAVCFDYHEQIWGNLKGFDHVKECELKEKSRSSLGMTPAS